MTLNHTLATSPMRWKAWPQGLLDPELLSGVVEKLRFVPVTSYALWMHSASRFANGDEGLVAVDDTPICAVPQSMREAPTVCPAVPVLVVPSILTPPAQNQPRIPRRSRLTGAAVTGCSKSIIHPWMYSKVRSSRRIRVAFWMVIALAAGLLVIVLDWPMSARLEMETSLAVIWMTP